MKKIYLFLYLILISASGFSQWTRLTSGTNKDLFSVHFPCKSTGYAVGGNENYYTSGVILKSVDAGQIWSALPCDTNNFYTSVFFTDSITGFVTGYDYNYSGIILKTTDGGNTWTTSLSGTTNRLYSVYFICADTGYVVGAYGAIFKTTNAGALWTSQASGTLVDLHSVCFVNDNSGIAAGNYIWHPYSSTMGTILSTNNSGNLWTGTAFDYGFNSVHFTNANTGYAAGFYIFYYGAGRYESGPVMLKTINGGGSWTTQDPGTSTFLSAVYFTDAVNGHSVGDSGTILVTINGGDHWGRQNSGTTTDLLSVYFTDDTTGYAAGRNGIILKTINGGGFPVGIDGLQSKSATLNIYPNPAAARPVTIETSQEPVNSRLSIMNANGQQVISLRFTGSKTQFDIANLPSGVYFVRLTADNMVLTGKFIKLQ